MVLSEISQLLKTVLSKRGAEELGGWLKGVYLPRIGCPPGLAEEFVNLPTAIRRDEVLTFSTFRGSPADTSAVEG